MSSVNGTPTPENAKLTAARSHMNSIKMFLNWLESDKNIHLCERNPNCSADYYRTFNSLDELLFEHFDIDKNKIEEERSKILEAIGS